MKPLKVWRKRHFWLTWSPSPRIGGGPNVLNFRERTGAHGGPSPHSVPPSRWDPHSRLPPRTLQEMPGLSPRSPLRRPPRPSTLSLPGVSQADTHQEGDGSVSGEAPPGTAWAARPQVGGPPRLGSCHSEVTDQFPHLRRGDAQDSSQAGGEGGFMGLRLLQVVKAFV